MKISTPRGCLDLAVDASLQIEETSPVLNDRGSQSLPLTVPATPHNAAMLAFPQRIDRHDPLPSDLLCTIHDGAFVRQGRINVISASPTDGITVNIGFDNAEAYAKWLDTRLDQLPAPVLQFGSATQLARHLAQVFTDGLASSEPYAVFPLCVQEQNYTDDEGQEQSLPVFLNRMLGGSSPSLVWAARHDTTVIDGALTVTSLPEAYGVTPFLYVWKVVDIIFQAFGYTLAENIFYTSSELRRLVVINNTADACVTGTLSLAELMPDATVEEFLHALYVRFGLVYHISTDSRTVSLSLLRDVVGAQPVVSSLQGCHTEEPLITYATPRQVRLSAATSLEGAAPPASRWEDFAAERVRQVVSVAAFSDEVARSASLVREVTTARWWQYDSANLRALPAGSSFFAWDRQTSGVETEDLASVDECVPMLLQTIGGVSQPVPQYRKGPRHRHTFLRTSDGTRHDSDDGETPLSFLLALPVVYGYTGPLAGTVVPYDVQGNRIQLAVPGAVHVEFHDFSFSLLFQFADGHFAQFWRQYDAVLRHAAHEVTIPAVLPVHMLTSLSFLRPCLFQGQRLLPDRISYALPAQAGRAAVEAVFRTLSLMGASDIDREQLIVSIPEAGQIIFVLQSTTLPQARAQARCDAEAYCRQRHPDVDIIRIQFQEEQLSFQGNTTPQDDPEVRDMRPEQEGLELIKPYSAYFTVTLWYKGVTINAAEGQPLTQSGTERFTAVVHYQATFVSRLV